MDASLPEIFIGKKRELGSLQSFPWNLRMIRAEEAIMRKLTGEGIKIGIIDTGYSPHIGLPEPVDTFSFSFDNTVDKNGHGTHVFGILSSILPKAEYYICKELDDKGNGTFYATAKSVYWLIERGVDVINMSLGGDQPNAELLEAIQFANKCGITIVVAAGNNGGKKLNFPAIMNEVIAVGAVDYRKVLAFFSNTGIELDAVAPGVDINSTWLNDTFLEISGTSMAAPHVAGVAGIFVQWFERINGRKPNADELKEILYGRALDINLRGRDKLTGHGIIRAKFDDDFENKQLKYSDRIGIVKKFFIKVCNAYRRVTRF